ncbi:MAG: bile acid:sodium symporter family protein [Propionibacteriaceae bacterium]|nr:bile acid:sodium symporter family protein [Propionibacteriaceae bacterium]
MSRLKIDRFTVLILAAVLVAAILPVHGWGATALSWATKVGIFVLFFLYGARLSPQEALAGLRHWRLHAVILAFTFVLFPVLGLALSLASPALISPGLYAGVLFLCLVPSTVQSSVTFTSIARGNIAGAIVSASASNLLGVVVTPLLAVALMSTTGTATINPRSILDIVVQLLLPFVLGQLSRPWSAAWVGRHKGALKWFDQGVIVAVVYAAFSAGMREGIWAQVGWADLVWLCVICIAVLALMLWLTHLTALVLGFGRDDRIAIQFCGTKKSLATGVPIASVLFAGQPIGLIVLPLMVFHQLQLLACAALASRYAAQPDTPEGAQR